MACVVDDDNSAVDLVVSDLFFRCIEEYIIVVFICDLMWYLVLRSVFFCVAVYLASDENETVLNGTKTRVQVELTAFSSVRQLGTFQNEFMFRIAAISIANNHLHVCYGGVLEYLLVD